MRSDSDHNHQFHFPPQLADLAMPGLAPGPQSVIASLIRYWKCMQTLIIGVENGKDYAYNPYKEGECNQRWSIVENPEVSWVVLAV